MSESKIDATDRLRREGRWGEATKFKDEMINSTVGFQLTYCK